MKRKTNQEIEQELNEWVDGMTAEEREKVYQLDDAMDTLCCHILKNRYGIKTEGIPGDRYHIKVDGIVMGFNDFEDYLEEHNIGLINDVLMSLLLS